MEHIELYQTAELNNARTRRKRAQTAMCIIGAIGLAACVALCIFVTRRNRTVLLPFIVGISILSGWAVIFLSHTFFSESRAAERHTELMLTGERETFSGSFQKTGEVKRVRNGVAVRKVLAFVDGRERVLTVGESKAALLPDRFTGKAETVYDFIAAYEADGDDDD